MEKTIKYEIEKHMVFSTAHITEGDSETLEFEATTNTVPVLGVYRYEYGFYIYISPEKEDDMILEHYSKHFLNLIKIAEKHDCKYLKLDCDGQIFNNLKTFDW